MLSYWGMTHWYAAIVGAVGALATLFGGGYMINTFVFSPTAYTSAGVVKLDTELPGPDASSTEELTVKTWPLPLDTSNYDERLLALADYKLASTSAAVSSSTAATTSPALPTVSPLQYSSSSNATVSGQLWPKAQPYPQGGAILPFHRILAYYGNFYSTRMGILGEFDQATVLARLKETKKLWEEADPTTPVLPAIQYIAMVAQAGAGADGMYRAVMPDKEIDKAYEMAKKAEGVLFLDLQVGLSTIEKELPQFTKYLMRPDVHLAIDPEFSMKTGAKPGTVIGTYDAADINYVINFLSQLVRTNQLPPKVLVIHRFTQDMITNAANIKATPEVQVVIDMDGWGSKDLKRGSYSRVITAEPVQFAGIKIFYYNDLKPPSTGLLTPAEVLRLKPKPIYIQYQ